MDIDTICHWAGVGLVFLFIGWACVGFWRGLSLRPSDPSTRPRFEGTWLRWF
jgi:hypothetical protein